MEIKNKNVFITGSTRGIGLAIAHHFAAIGANVVLNGRSEVSAEVLASFDQYGVKVAAISGDVSDAADAKRMIEAATEALGSVDILINNAGITADKLMLKMTADDFEKVLNISSSVPYKVDKKELEKILKKEKLIWEEKLN